MSQPEAYILSSTSTPNSGIFKLSSIILTSLFCLLVLALSTAYLLKTKNRFLPTGLTPLATINYTRTPSSTLGTNFVPILDLPVKVGKYQHTYEFLLDSGAVVSTLPILEEAGLDLDQLNRIILGSATDHVTYGYLTQMDIDLNRHTLTLPVALSDISVPVLGRHGFFDRYTLIFDHQLEAVTIAQSQ